MKERSRKIIVHSQFEVDTPVSLLASRSGIKEHVLYSELRALREANIIKPIMFVDMSSFGLTQCDIYFSFRPYTPESRKRVLDLLCSNAFVRSVAEFGGKYNIGISLCVPTNKHGHVVLQSILEEAGVTLEQLSVGLLVLATIFRKRYLYPQYEKADFITLQETPNSHKCDEIDFEVVRSLLYSDSGALSKVARNSPVPRTTFNYRFERLIEKKVVSKRMFFVNQGKLKIPSYNILLQTTGLAPAERKALDEFCLEHPNVVYLKRVLGQWDIQLTVETERFLDLTKFTEALNTNFRQFIRDIEVLQSFKHHLSSVFLKDLDFHTWTKRTLGIDEPRE